MGEWSLPAKDMATLTKFKGGSRYYPDGTVWQDTPYAYSSWHLYQVTLEHLPVRPE